MRRRKRLETKLVQLEDLQSTIRVMKAVWSDYETEIEVIESSCLIHGFYVTIWGL